MTSKLKKQSPAKITKKVVTVEELNKPIKKRGRPAGSANVPKKKEKSYTALLTFIMIFTLLTAAATSLTAYILYDASNRIEERT